MKLEHFKQPENKYRMKPFWFWNGDITEGEIDRQLKEMKKQGIGGIFVCPRQGQTVSYLSKRWFELVRYACDKAAEYNLEFWLYDEYPYPSGMSGGRVLLEHPDAVHTQLKYQSYITEGNVRKKYFLGWSKILYAGAVELSNDGSAIRERVINLMDDIGVLQEQEILQFTGLTDYGNKRFFTYGPQHMLEVNLPEGNWKIEIYTQETFDDYKYFGNFFDPCDKAAVQTFLQTTHERYYEEMGDKFGTQIFGIFSDEVGFIGDIPWSKHLPEYIQNRYHYDILEVLPALHDKNYRDGSKIRYEFYQSAHELLRESYHKQVSNWCREHGLKFVSELPSMRRSTQIYSSVPGGDACHDKLGVSLEEVYDKYLINYRSCAPGIASLARQTGKETAMVECFHSIGWSMTIQDAKWMIDWMAAMGIGFYTPHAFYYTTDSITKYDAPPSQFFQNPYWEHYSILTDYAGRLSALIGETEPTCNIALLDPVTSLWTRLGNPRKGFVYAGNDMEEKAELERMKTDWMFLAKTLLFEQISFDFLDSELLYNGEIEDGNISIGKANYELLILPPMTSIECIATDKIKEFVQKGGKVIACGLLPYEIIDEDIQVEEQYMDLFKTADSNKKQYWSTDSSERNEIKKMDNTIFIPTTGSICQEEFRSKFIEEIRNCVNMDASISIIKGNPKEIYSSVRIDKENKHYIIIGNHGNEDCSVRLSMKQDFYSLGQMDLSLGKIYGIYDGEEKSETVISLKAYECKVLVFNLPRDDMEKMPEAGGEIKIDMNNQMDISVSERNVCLLDEFKVSLDHKEWRENSPKTFIEMCDELQWLTGKNISYAGKFGTPKQMEIQYPIDLYIKTDFMVEKKPAQIWLMMDKRSIGSDACIVVNNHAIDNNQFFHEFINDNCNQICDISKMVQEGYNHIDIQVCVKKDWDGIRDPLYLLGDFGIRDGVIAEAPAKSHYAKGSAEGYPWCSGTFTFKTELNLLEIPESEFVIIKPEFSETVVDCIEILVNGESIGVKSFAPYEWICPVNLLTLNNLVELKITNTLSGMFENSYFDYESHKLMKK